MKIVFFILICSFLIISCKERKKEYISLEGIAQGGTFRIKYEPIPDTISVKEIYKILNEINSTLSLYDTNSIISRINKNDTAVMLNRYFIEIYREAYKVYQQTDGAFDITVAPLVQYWGFIPKVQKFNNIKTTDSLLKLVGVDKIHLQKEKIIKDYADIKLDMNGIAQGFTVDKISMYLESKKIKNYMIEVGGEVKVKGKNQKGELWKIGIDKPIENSNEFNRELQTVLSISDVSLATSGSYRKFIEKDGIKYSHTINPRTGIPTFHNLLSVTVLHSSCTYADAIATAIMVMGLEAGKRFVKENKISAYFIYSDETGNYKTWASKDIEDKLKPIQ